MSQDDKFDLADDQVSVRLNDPRERDAARKLREFFGSHREHVFFSRQIEVQNENEYFHWITNRAIRDLRDEGFILGETRLLRTGGNKSSLASQPPILPSRCEAAGPPRGRVC